MNFVRQTAKEPGLEDRVRILGFVSRDELVYLCRNAYALAYPSFFDPDSIPPMEAIALGCPVIAADVSGARERMGAPRCTSIPVTRHNWPQGQKNSIPGRTSPNRWSSAIMSAPDR